MGGVLRNEGANKQAALVVLSIRTAQDDRHGSLPSRRIHKFGVFEAFATPLSLVRRLLLIAARLCWQPAGSWVGSSHGDSSRAQPGVRLIATIQLNAIQMMMGRQSDFPDNGTLLRSYYVLGVTLIHPLQLRGRVQRVPGLHRQTASGLTAHCWDAKGTVPTPPLHSIRRK